MAEDWFEDFGFSTNPFEIDLLEDDLELVGRENEAKEILYRIDSGNMLLIKGKAGTGKTILLRHAIDNFKGEGKVIYIDANKLSKRLAISDLLKKKPKGMILLLDNVQSLSEKNNEMIKYHYDQDDIKSVVFTTTVSNQARFTDAIKDRIGRNVITLKKRRPAEAAEIVRQILGDNNEILPDNVLKQLYIESDKNMNIFLEKCSLLCDYLHTNEKKVAEKSDISKMPKRTRHEPVEDETKNCDNCEEDLVKVKDYWRCNNCDEFCDKCGALVDEDDESCPECGKELALEEEE